jgi:hypothetical protein
MSIKSYKPKWPRRAYLGPAGDWNKPVPLNIEPLSDL